MPSCDTLVAMGDVTEMGSIIFAKNSDRQTNEPMSIRYVPAGNHAANSKLKTTFIEIDQVQRTNACVLFSPTNIFGAEMGFNSHGLVIGNEALFTRIPSDVPALTGMDLVRLVLERCTSSAQGKQLIVDLLKRYGQGGNCGFTSYFTYQNSFLLVDRHEAWLVETVGREYAAKRIVSGIRTISNEISFTDRTSFDEYSPNLIAQAIDRGWCKSIDDFDFRRCYSGFSFRFDYFYNSWLKTKLASSRERQCRALNILETCQSITVENVMAVLRDHHGQRQHFNDNLTEVTLCMHAGFGPIRFSQTTGSLISIIPRTNNIDPIHFATCSSNPCLSIFKPLWLTNEFIVPDFLADDSSRFLCQSSVQFSIDSLWWKYELIHRTLTKYYRRLSSTIDQNRDPFERTTIEKALHLTSRDAKNLFSLQCFIQADQMENHWFEEARRLSMKYPGELSLLNELSWELWRRKAKIPSDLLCYSKPILFIGKTILSIGSVILPWQWNMLLCPSVFFVVQVWIRTKQTVVQLPRLNFRKTSQ